MDWPSLAGSIQTVGQTIIGESVTHTPAGGAPKTITGVYDGVSTEINTDTDRGGAIAIQSTDPAITVRLAALAVQPTVGDAITVRSTNYTIAEIHPDGQGDARLKLEEV